MPGKRTIRTMRLFLALLMTLSGVCAGAQAAASETPDVAAARQARDRGDEAAMSAALDTARADAERSNRIEAHLRHALFAHWMVEVSYARDDKKLGKSAAEEGIAAAEKAVALDPNSSPAHAMLGRLYGELIPFAMLGGIRFGPKSDRELTKAMELDPKNAEAHIGEGINKIFTPSAFGGSLPLAIELLKKAIELDPSSDTAHAWLAQAYETSQQHAKALEEIAAAERLNPQRQWLRYVRSQITTGNKK
jgi:tetratricopeptide (TPR) repeat protein